MRGAEICLGSDSVVELVTPIVPNLAESASRSRSEAGFPLEAGNNFVLIICQPMFGVVLAT